MKIVNSDEYSCLEEAETDPATLLMKCKATLLEENHASTAEEMRKAGELIK